MPYPTIVVNSFNTSTAGKTIMNGTPEDGIENRQYPRRYYNFNMVVTQQFPYKDETQLFLSDDSSVNQYMLIDRLNKPVIADELQPYAAMRRCIPCQFDAVTKTVKILGCLPPTSKYIDEFVNPVVDETTPASNPTPTEETTA